ncbi:CGI-121-domain-containing protein [Dendrothele bispora CBS 962.96]|uniref:EKC/KEOPS complex subunit CGI121 n=1 Tax=Dendrothele bispora (strain CBS 962.96) TaxID=1314807 RepID=A0A4V4HIQ3_DENBC|nr:CGI-121-domain-containing protein [Dendrothele bispora CBS 962.96]
MQSFVFDHIPNNNIAYFALYSPVQNPAELKRRIIEAAKIEGEEGDKERDAVNFAFIDASLITSKLHLETAIYQAILAESQGSLRTKTVHSEILFALNPTNNITEAIRRYGVSDSTKSLLIAHITDKSKSSSAIEEKLNKVVDGTMVSFKELDAITDWDRIKKYYKLEKESKEKGAIQSQRSFIDNVVVSSVAMKTVMQ